MLATLGKTTGIELEFGTASLDEKLVNLHDASRSYAGAGKKDAMAREVLVLAVTNILQHDLKDQERALVADILMSLIKQAEIDLRESISERLSMMEGVPAEVVLQLAHDTISVAKPVLEFSPVLTEFDLLYIIRSKTAEYWRAITQRKLLQDAVVDALVECKDAGTAIGLIKNPNIKLNETAIEAFAELSKYSDMVAAPLLSREGLSEKVVTTLYWHVSGQLREHILRRFDIPKAALDAALQDALEDYTNTARLIEDPKPTKLMSDIAAQYASLERINDGMLIKTLRRGQVRFFMALMSERTGLPYTTVHELMRQVGGQGMAIACKATGIGKESFISLFLLARSYTRGDRAVDAIELRKAIKYYDTASQEMAATIMANTIIVGTKQ